MYNSIVLSENKEKEKDIKESINYINKIANTYLFIKEDLTFDEMVSKETIKITMIRNLSDWLKNEYYLNKQL